jgi:hypothetical protein
VHVLDNIVCVSICCLIVRLKCFQSSTACISKNYPARQSQVGPITLGFHQQTFYLTEVESTAVESITTAVVSTTTEVESVDVVTSVEVPDPQDAKVKTVAKAKTVKIVFIYLMVLYCVFN